MVTHVSFEQDFRRKVREIDSRAERAGTNWTRICRELGISRTTPNRWHQRAPTTVALIDRVERYLDDIEQGRAMADADVSADDRQGS